MTETLQGLSSMPSVGAIDMRVVQCRTAIAVCKRDSFSPPLLRALSAKVLEVESDALVLKRSLRGPRAAPPSKEGKRRDKRATDASHKDRHRSRSAPRSAPEGSRGGSGRKGAKGD